MQEVTFLFISRLRQLSAHFFRFNEYFITFFEVLFRPHFFDVLT